MVLVVIFSFNPVMGPKYEIGTRNHSRTDAVVTKNEHEASSPIIFLLDSKHESESRTSLGSILNESASGSSKSSELSCSTFSSSSGYSSDDFILVNPKIASNSISLKIPSSKFLPDDKLELNTSTSSASGVLDITDESLLTTVPSTKCPSIQVMERQGGYDPNRVPSSIFESKSSTPNEWSAASDESLFSINVSLSRDHNSRELSRCVELDRCEELSKSGELVSFGHLPAVKEEHMETSFDAKRGVVTGNNFIETGTQHKPIKKEVHFEGETKLRGNRDFSIAVGHSEGNGGFRDSYSAPHHSNGNDKSLAFPTDKKSTEPFCHVVYYTKKKSRWPLCFYSHCSCGSCCSRWPSCCCKSASCLSCKWSSWICFSCKWLSWSCCFHKWPSKQGCCCK
ncbi:uncharacterized protein LOC132626152 isoform X1 [Lycium barbarum]|uniref:uncharacterized protein LOC132626152 isoform X1 n=2 Tax=Lycium barbarum TaxID=112863 RepID=UPI00293E3D41|nr:uncharacterized protein LOC132626152 isoform X1 [Lycium barbarum]XP_060196892.1 uncharacterized protein LOC132626152 isoform X1 [Lycium barbarum]XP_060196893.1 uncharacterized protein LOC132626152 isoform X1 [Lycium barbarum]XP_060196894.1 uncharacterized protein LOC132626152 isoform X1 [Lycium barbarum]